MWNKFITQVLLAFFFAAACRRPSSILAERSLAASPTLKRLDFPRPKRHSGMLTS